MLDRPSMRRSIRRRYPTASASASAERRAQAVCPTAECKVDSLHRATARMPTAALQSSASPRWPTSLKERIQRGPSSVGRLEPPWSRTNGGPDSVRYRSRPLRGSGDFQCQEDRRRGIRGTLAPDTQVASVGRVAATAWTFSQHWRVKLDV